MTRLDLTEPRFTQKDGCAITGLSSKTFQNRASRGEIALAQQHPGRQSKRLYSPLNLMSLYFIDQLVAQGITASVAAGFAPLIEERATEWWDEHPETIDPDGVPTIVLKLSEWKRLKQGYLFVDAGDGNTRFLCFNQEEDTDVLQSLLPDVYVLVQIDVLISTIINKIHHHLQKGSSRD